MSLFGNRGNAEEKVLQQKWPLLLNHSEYFDDRSFTDWYRQDLAKCHFSLTGKAEAKQRENMEIAIGLQLYGIKLCIHINMGIFILGVALVNKNDN